MQVVGHFHANNLLSDDGIAKKTPGAWDILTPVKAVAEKAPPGSDAGAPYRGFDMALHTRIFQGLMTSTALIAAVATVPAQAQDAPATATADEAEASEIVVTGSRIRRAESDNAVPIVDVDQQAIVDRGYISVADALNDLPSNVPMLNQADGGGESSGPGIQSPNLFGLGVGRTLTLVNGRRMVTSAAGIGAGNGIGDAQVDSNIIPIGLLDRIEVYQGGGAAVYGSDAIAGVVNYILKDDFEGLELDAQSGISGRGDYDTYALRGTAGTNFAGGRGNVAVDVGWSSTPMLYFSDRPLSNLGRLTVSNPANTSDSDGIPALKEIFNSAFWPFNTNGVIFNAPAPPPSLLTRDASGSPLQFSPSGDVVPYNMGTYANIPFASGGDGFPYQELVGLRTGVERLTANLVGHYDLTDRVTISTELLYARTRGTQLPQGNSYTTLSGGTYAGPIAFTIDNPFLTDQARAVLSAARPSFAAGSPLFLSKYFYDLVPDNSARTTTDTYRAALSLDGDFDVGDRNFYWSVSASYGRVEGQQRGWGVITERFNNAIDAVSSGGQIVCGINADADPTNDDAACAPINPFGAGNVSQAARDYVSTRTGMDWTNEQVDVLATLGGTVVALPTGEVAFSTAYEHRNEYASFTPLEANALGLIGDGTQVLAQSGSYNTDELSAEVIVPLIGGDITLPLVQALELKGAFRYVDNSIAGTENVWDLGLRWKVTDGVTLRASRSRNFRAPTLTQLLSPTTSGFGAAGFDPCDADRINGGPDPATRYQNCLALFQANPGYGVYADGTNAGASAATRLAGFQSGTENFETATILSGGNPNLRNETSKVWTYGIVLEPRFIPGLTFSADRIEIDLSDGLVFFDTADFAAACYDSANPDPSVCNAFTRLATADPANPGGTIITGTSTTFNAGVIRYRGEVYTLDYRFPLDTVFGGDNLGNLRLTVQATHNALYETSITGETFTRIDNTYISPTWSGRFNAVYDRGPLRVSYQLDYLDETRSGTDATIETTPNPVLAANVVQSISAQYDLGDFSIRGGIDNFTDTQPSYPQIAYGDILGRRFYLGVHVKLR